MARRFKSIDDCRRYLADLIHRVEDGSLDPGVAGRLTYIANSIIGAIKDSDLEKRLAELERKLK